MNVSVALILVLVAAKAAALIYWTTSLAFARKVSRIQRAYMFAGSAQACLNILTDQDEKTLETIAARQGVEVGYTGLVTAMRLVADVWPSSRIARDMQLHDLRYQALTSGLPLSV